MSASRSSIVVAALLFGCQHAPSPEADASANVAPLAPTPFDASADAPSANELRDHAAALALSNAELRALSGRLSEPDRPFFSDNFVSNETSYLHVAPSLARSPGTTNEVYVGVGPEQTFAYLALVRPRLGFVVDIRRENKVLHQLYQAAFSTATSRSHFLTLLVGRPYDAASCPPATATLDEVIRHAEKLAPTEASYAAAHEALVRAIEQVWGALDAKDTKSLTVAHRAFFLKQLDLAFELKEHNGRVYPRLRSLLAATDREGKMRGFLASEEAFRFVATMERENRVVPFVGDLAGDHALPELARYLAAEHLVASTVYVSNVEQYLFDGTKLAAWTKNLAGLPSTPRAVVVRAYLDQGKKHPAQVEGHRTVTLLQRVSDFGARQKTKPYGTFWELVNEPPPSP